MSNLDDKDEGRAGLKLAAIYDSYLFTPLGHRCGFLVPTVVPARLMRDLCTMRGGASTRRTRDPSASMTTG
jgi:hypothetical protein